jgi:hypothetical protein
MASRILAGGENRELPPFAECRGERDRGAEDRSDRGLSGSIQERARVLAPAQSVHRCECELA